MAQQLTKATFSRRDGNLQAGERSRSSTCDRGGHYDPGINVAPPRFEIGFDIAAKDLPAVTQPDTLPDRTMIG